MSRLYLVDLRERAVARVLAVRASIDGGSVEHPRNASGALADAVRATGSPAPGKIGWHSVGVPAGRRDGLVKRTRRDFTLRGLIAALAAHGIRIDYVQVWRFVHAKGLRFKKTRAARRTASPVDRERSAPWALAR